MTALLAALVLAGSPAPGRDPTASDDPLGEADDDRDEPATDDVRGEVAVALAEVEAQAESIAARVRRARAQRGRASFWPRIAVTVSLDEAARGRLDRAAARPPRLSDGRPDRLVWSVVASWGAP